MRNQLPRAKCLSIRARISNLYGRIGAIVSMYEQGEAHRRVRAFSIAWLSSIVGLESEPQSKSLGESESNWLPSHSKHSTSAPRQDSIPANDR